MDAVRVFTRTASRNPEQLMLFDRTDSVTYGEADRRSDAIAADLIGRGVADGARLGLCAPDRVSLWLAIIGAWKAGALPALIDARTDPTDLPYFIGDIDADVVVATPDLHEKLATGGARSVIDLDHLGRTGRDLGAHRHGQSTPLYLSYTSGTTGPPKGAILESGPVTLGAACVAERLGLSRRDVLLSITPTASSFQLVAALLPAIHVGASVGLLAGASVEESWERARRVGATVLVAYPLTLADMVNAPDPSDSPFRLALSGGSPLGPRIKRDYRDRLGIPLIESYGQSELGGFMALGRPDDDDAPAGFAGRPLPDRLTFIGDPVDGAELPVGEVGEVLVSHGFFAGYRNKPEQSIETLRGGVLHTGDLGVADADGRIKVLGRTREADAVRRRGGFLREVEDACYDVESVKHAAVVESDDGRIHAFVELLEGHGATSEEIADEVGKVLTEGLVPDRVEVLDEMPRTFSGKADRRVLSQLR
jgi:long-chain acyl-CoA synthetase